jgi:hypothetical protein
MTPRASSLRDAGLATAAAVLVLAGTAGAAPDDKGQPPPLCDASVTDRCTLATPWKDWIAAHKSRGTLLGYAVKCALPEGAAVTVSEGVTLAGGWGLLPGWQRGSLDGDGQELVSSCLLAHINAFGEKVTIVIAGPDVPFDAPPSFRHMEGAYFGNLFASPPKKNACKGAGDGFGGAAVDGDKRICSSNGAACGLDAVGACWSNPEAGCTRWAGTAPRVYCAEARDRAGNVYRHPITVYLRAAQ